MRKTIKKMKKGNGGVFSKSVLKKLHHQNHHQKQKRLRFE